MVQLAAIQESDDDDEEDEGRSPHHNTGSIAIAPSDRVANNDDDEEAYVLVTRLEPPSDATPRIQDLVVNNNSDSDSDSDSDEAAAVVAVSTTAVASKKYTAVKSVILEEKSKVRNVCMYVCMYGHFHNMYKR